MNVLWITNILFPEAEQILTGNGELKASGGWMLGAANAILTNNDNIKLSVATVSRKVNHLTKLVGEQITYYVLPFGKGNLDFNSDYCPLWEQVNKEVMPSVVHIHGTEFSHGYAYMKACGNDNVVISIQGLTSSYYYYYYGLTKSDVFRNITFRDLLKGTILHEQKIFARRAKYEVAMLKMAKHIIGRTSWDRAHAWTINPDAKYHFCNETLRPEFYDGSEWNYGKSDKHTIFLSQAGYPIKGLHQVLKAMPIILQHYPDTSVRIAGSDITKSATLSEKLRLSGYGKYIQRLIKKLHLEEKIIFTGNLNAEQMKQEYLRTNVFVCPSSIENSPNSLGEAQILGTPCVASYVGGVSDMMVENETCLYRFEEIEMLAEKVCRVFANADKQVDMRLIALKRHNPDTNCKQLISIYKLVGEMNHAEG